MIDIEFDDFSAIAMTLHGDGQPTLTDDQFLEMLARDVDVIDVVPAEALMGSVRYMPALATEQVVAHPLSLMVGHPGERMAVPDDEVPG